MFSYGNFIGAALLFKRIGMTSLDTKDYLGDQNSVFEWIFSTGSLFIPLYIDCLSIVYLQLLVPYFQLQIQCVHCRYSPKLSPKHAKWIYTWKLKLNINLWSFVLMPSGFLFFFSFLFCGKFENGYEDQDRNQLEIILGLKWKLDWIILLGIFFSIF